MKIKNTKTRAFRVILYAVLIALALVMLVPFAWMLSASFKLDKDVFIFPIQWIPENPRWQNYVDIWNKIPLAKFVLNTVKLTLIVTFLQLLTSSFAAYAFAKLQFKGKNTLFLAYITTIAVPWQVYMVPQFILVSKMGLNDTHIGLMLMQAFSAFGVFLMRQFYISIPDELCEAARIDGLNEFGIFSKIIFPLGKPGMATLTIFIPLVTSACIRMGVDPRAAVVGVITASCVSIMTPMAAPCQIMIIEPGGYTLKDYLKCGTPLALILIVVSVFFLPTLYPFA